MGIQVVGHSSFLGHTGYANHSRNFFTYLSKIIPVRVRNYSYTKDLTYLTSEERSLLIEQDWQDPPFKIGTPFVPNPDDIIVNIVLNESHHYYFYDKYTSPMIAYNVWEATKQIPEFFNRILQFDQFWCPSEWQKQCTIDQGYPEHRVKVVPEGVNGSIFKPIIHNIEKEKKILYKQYGIPENVFTFMIFGRWDYRKSVTELFQAFNQEFKNTDNVMLIASVDNPFSVDGLKTTEERLKYYKVESDKIKILHFPKRSDYIRWLQLGDVFLSCSRSEGWNLPLMEAIACGTPSICSGWGAQLEFADGIAHTVNILKFQKPKHVFMIDDNADIGVWSEPDFNHLQKVMRDVYNNWKTNKEKAIKLSRYIRALYTWENAARIASQHIYDLIESKKTFVISKTKEKQNNEIKLNLGCGNHLIDGYINIDKYNNTGNVDLKADIGQLPYRDKTVDEILTSHVFEHISIADMYSVLNEWRRVLKDSGRLVLYLPDLEHEVNVWLNTPDDKKWLEVHRIFGAQSHPGNTHYCGFNLGSLQSFLESFNFHIENISIGNRGFGEEIQCMATKLPDEVVRDATYICHFVDGPFLEIQGDPNDKGYYVVDFLDPENNASVHQITLRTNCWTRPFRKYFTNWLVTVRRNGVLTFKHKFNLQNKNVLISFDTKSIGDTIAWIPAVEEFRKKHNCNVIVSTFWNKLFRGHPTYKNLRFIEPGTVVNNLYASYSIGCYTGDSNKNIKDWRTVPLGQVATDTLGLEYKEIITDLAIKPGRREIKDRYVTLSEHSTFQRKYWNYKNGWQEVVNFLDEHGYKTVVISKEKTSLKNIIDRTNRSIEHSITNIYYSKLFLGVSSGPAWLAWALRKPVIMVSGFSQPWAEFQTNCERVINMNVCHGCFNCTDYEFDRGNWAWCKYNGTEREYECTKEISPEMVIEKIRKILKI